MFRQNVIRINPAVFIPVFLAVFSCAAYASDSAGKAAYQQYCQACHQAGGAGVPGVFPPMVNNPNVMGKPDYVAQVIIEGVRGPLEVNGRQYNGVMPPMSYISNQAIADLVNYMEKEWGEGGRVLSPEDVEALR